jgi:hypothetical protein
MYLDTSAVRALSGKYEQLIGVQIFTSILTVFELLDGCCRSESEYRKRKAALKTMFTSKISIVLEMPLVAVAKSFTEICADYTISDTEPKAIMQLAHKMLITPSIKEFKTQIDNDLEWNRICGAYNEVVRRSIDRAIFTGRILREKFTDISNDDMALLRINSKMPPDQRFQAFIYGDINRALSIYVLSLTYSENLDRGNGVEFQQKIYDSYDGSSEPYILALSISLLERMERGEIPAKNDAFDLNHFAYLTPSTILITKDKRMRTLATKVGVRSSRELTLM